MAAALTVWACRKPRVSRVGRPRRKIHSRASMTSPARTNPTTGETTIGMITLSTTPLHLTVPAEASPAPTSPPIRPCDDEDGRP
jgi:hypothetical protein